GVGKGRRGGGIARGRSGAARAVWRSARPRALPLHAVAARPLHAAEPADQAVVALGLRLARRMAGKAAIAANAGLLKSRRGGAKAMLPASSVASPAAPLPPRAQRAPYRAAARSGLPCRGGGSRPCDRRLPCAPPRAAPAPLRASAHAPCN